MAATESVGFWQARKVVVAGSTGFLGSYVTARLENLGADVTGVSLSLGTDLRDLDQTQRAMKSAAPSIVFNCAGHQGGSKGSGLKGQELFSISRGAFGKKKDIRSFS